jgi:hypothetical protein
MVVVKHDGHLGSDRTVDRRSGFEQQFLYNRGNSDQRANAA